MLVARDSIDAGAHIANGFGKLRDLPEHPLFPHIHARLAMGEPPFAVAGWVQATVPPADPYGPTSMPLMTLNSRLRGYAVLLPATVKVPRSYLDELTKGLFIEVNVVAELDAAIVSQKRRISAFAENEKTLPPGMTSEQQRKQVVTLADLLVKMRDTQIALGLVPQSFPRAAFRARAWITIPSAQTLDPVPSRQSAGHPPLDGRGGLRGRRSYRTGLAGPAAQLASTVLS